MDIIPDRIERTLGSRRFLTFALSFFLVMLTIILTAIFGDADKLTALTGPLGVAAALASSAIISGHMGDAKVRSEIVKADSTRPPADVNVKIDAQTVEVPGGT